MGSEGYVVAVSVCLSVCLLSHILPLGLLENAATYSAGDEGQKISGVFFETVPLQRSSAPSHDGHTSGRPFFPQKTRMRIVHTQVR